MKKAIGQHQLGVGVHHITQAGIPSTPTAQRSPQPKSPFPAPVSSAVVSLWRGESARLGNEMSKL